MPRLARLGAKGFFDWLNEQEAETTRDGQKRIHELKRRIEQAKSVSWPTALRLLNQLEKWGNITIVWEGRAVEGIYIPPKQFFQPKISTAKKVETEKQMEPPKAEVLEQKPAIAGVALLVDWDNAAIVLQEAGIQADAKQILGPIDICATGYGQIKHRAAFLTVKTSKRSEVEKELDRFGFLTTVVPALPDEADKALTQEALLIAADPKTTIFVIVSSDSTAFVGLVKKLMEAKKRVVMINILRRSMKFSLAGAETVSLYSLMRRDQRLVANGRRQDTVNPFLMAIITSSPPKKLSLTQTFLVELLRIIQDLFQKKRYSWIGYGLIKDLAWQTLRKSSDPNQQCDRKQFVQAFSALQTANLFLIEPLSYQEMVVNSFSLNQGNGHWLWKFV